MKISQIDLKSISADAADHLPRATYFIVEAHDDCILAPFEHADEYSIHIGLPDRPDLRHAWKSPSLCHVLRQLRVLHGAYPHTALWLSTEEILAQMVGDTIGEAVANAMAEVDPGDEDCEWVQLSRIATRANNDQGALRGLLKDWLIGRDVSDAMGDVLDHI